MNDEELALFTMTLAALNAANAEDSAEAGFIESAEPMTASCTVERSE